MNTTYFLNTVMGNLFRTKTSPSLPTSYYIGLSSTAPHVDGTGCTEPSKNGTGYTRVLLDNLSLPVDGVITNTSAITFNESLADWGIMTHYVVFDSEEGGNLLFYDELSKSRTLEANTVLAIRSGELTIALRNITYVENAILGGAW